MKAKQMESTLLGRLAGRAFLAPLFVAAIFVPMATAADYSEKAVEWKFESGLDNKAFVEAFKAHSQEDFRITDIESYSAGRSRTVTTIWSKLPANEKWVIEVSMPVGDFLKAHEKHTENGFHIVEFEIDRTGGASLHFTGIWVKSDRQAATEFYIGMESLPFSNRYGEMADRGYRLTDFEAYESNGKFRNAGIWMKNEGKEVRFYRVIPRVKFAEVASSMEKSGFRMLDIEGYNHEGDFVFAAEWVRQEPGQESTYAYDLLADEFYNKHAALMREDYRLTEFEAYEERGATYYAGSWLKPTPGDYVPEEDGNTPRKKMSLEAFRSGSQ